MRTQAVRRRDAGADVAILPDPLSRRRALRLLRRSRRDARRDRAVLARRCRRLRRLHEASEEIFKVGFEQLGDVPFSKWTDMATDRARDDPAVELSQRLRPGLEVLSRCAPAHRVQLPSAADRRQSVHRKFDLLPDRLPGAALGRAFCDGRHRAAGRRAGGADRGAGRRGSLRRRGARDPRPGRRGQRREAGLGREHRRRHRRLQRRLRPGPIGICCRRQRGRAGPTGASIARAIR